MSLDVYAAWWLGTEGGTLAACEESCDRKCTHSQAQLMGFLSFGLYACLKLI